MLCHYHYHLVEKPEIVEQPKDRTVELNTNVNLTVTAKGRDLTFEWVKHGSHPDDDTTISEDDDSPYRMTETVYLRWLLMYTFIVW